MTAQNRSHPDGAPYKGASLAVETTAPRAHIRATA